MTFSIPDPQNVLDFMNREKKTAFRLSSRLAGGYQDGAYRVEDSNGKSAVLKLTAVPHSVSLIEQLRARGYPTPEYLLFGTLPDGTPYLLQEFALGTPLAELTPEYTDQLIALNRLQANLNPTGERPEGNWSDYAHNTIFANESDWSACLHQYSAETRRLVEAIEERAAPDQGTVLPTTDAVHGDWSPGNILVMDGRITSIIDTAYAGYGTRAIDLATLLHEEYSHRFDTEVCRLLREEILSIGGKPMLTLLLLYRVLAMVAFAISHHGEEGVALFTDSGWRILQDL